jgi:hypothetical protein
VYVEEEDIQDEPEEEINNVEGAHQQRLHRGRGSPAVHERGLMSGTGFASLP